MEMRTINQVKFYVLYLNPVTGRCEDSIPIAASPDYEKLVDWYNNQKCEIYHDSDGYNKSFEKGSSLEYYNPTNISIVNPDSLFGHGIFEQWLTVDTELNVVNPSDHIIWIF